MATRISGTRGTSGPDWTSSADAASQVHGPGHLNGSGAAGMAASVERSTGAGSLPGLEEVLTTLAHEVQDGDLPPQTDVTRVAIERMIQARMPNLPPNEKAARADELHAILSTDANFQALLAQALRSES